MKKRISMEMGIVGAVAGLCAGFAAGADYAWLSNPINAQWLGAANWSLGEWMGDASDTAAFDASATREIDVNGDVATAGVIVRNADYVFTNGTLTVNGAFNVGEGATATVFSTLRQDSESTRFDKTGAGALIVKGDASTTNTYHRFALHGGATVLDGGVHRVTGSGDETSPGWTSPQEARVPASFNSSSTLTLTGGAVFSFDQTSPMPPIAVAMCL